MTLKDKIITEALRQFSTKGFMSTSTADIIEAAGTSKGGLYNHFDNKEQLFYEVLEQAKSIWRERNLAGVHATARPLDKIKKILENYRDNYLADSTNFPGGCIFINFAIELNDQQPALAEAVNDGLVKLKKMLKRLLDEEYASGTLRDDVDTRNVVELLYSGLLGACVAFTSEKSEEGLNVTINSLIEYLDQLCK
jgi:AcrR family transcriptional regulator